MVSDENHDATLTVKIRRSELDRLKSVARDVGLPTSTVARVVVMDYVTRAEAERAQERA